MPSLSIPNSFNPGTQAKSSEVNANFAAVKTFVDALATGVNLDAGSIVAAKLDAGVLNIFTPVGGMVQFAGASAPAGGKWMICDGAAISRTSYATLFSTIGTAYGAGDGSTTFNIPNLKGRVPVGLDSSQTEFDALAKMGGDKNGVAQHTHGTTGSITVNNNTTGIYGTAADAGTHTHSGYADDNGFHIHSMTVDQLDATVAHGHGTDGTLMSGSSATPSGTTGAYTESSGLHGHNLVINPDGLHGHNLSLTDPAHSHSVTNGLSVTSFGTSGGNLQPFIVVNYLIRVA